MSSPAVSTSYADGSANTVRPESRTYPDGRVVTFDYGAADGINDRLSRIEALVDDDSTVLAEYQYLGLGAVVQQDSPEADLRSTLVSLTGTNDPDTGDIYSGLDRFGRVTDVRWRDVSANTDLSRVQYGYDMASNRTFRKNPTDTNSHHDWSYGYDGLQRLKYADRGTLASPPTGVTDPQFAQCWSLDATGNWAGFRQANTGNPWSLVQSRTANAVNEITAITNSTGSAWAQPAYDPAGNMTTIPQPDDPTEKYTATYDAWNRLVKLVDPATGHTVQENVYDARGYRIIKKSYTGGSLTETRHYYYTNGWRCVEERVGTSPDAERQHVWGVRYIDDLVLRDQDTDNSGTLDERLYACQDGNWNTTAVVATDGTVQERYEYDPYGDLSVLAPDFTPRGASSFDWNLTYAGYRFDATTGLYQVRFRLLHPMLMWITRDPIGYNGGDINLLSYVFGSPISWVDPEGMQIMPSMPYSPPAPQPGQDGVPADSSFEKVCGYSIWLLTGNWCSEPQAVLNATDAWDKGYDEQKNCLWDCIMSANAQVIAIGATAASGGGYAAQQIPIPTGALYGNTSFSTWPTIASIIAWLGGPDSYLELRQQQQQTLIHDAVRHLKPEKRTFARMKFITQETFSRCYNTLLVVESIIVIICSQSCTAKPSSPATPPPLPTDQPDGTVRVGGRVLTKGGRHIAYE